MCGPQRHRIRLVAADFARWPSPIPFVLRFKCGSVEAPNPWKTRGARRPAECDGISSVDLSLRPYVVRQSRVQVPD